jgi:hypothetical protein
MHSDYSSAARTAGEPMEKNAVVGQESDYIYISKTLFGANSPKDMYLRGLVVFDFQGVGRISEVSIFLVSILFSILSNI